MGSGADSSPVVDYAHGWPSVGRRGRHLQGECTASASRVHGELFSSVFSVSHDSDKTDRLPTGTAATTPNTNQSCRDLVPAGLDDLF
jgi:hypothetical protein